MAKEDFRTGVEWDDTASGDDAKPDAKDDTLDRKLCDFKQTLIEEADYPGADAVNKCRKIISEHGAQKIDDTAARVEQLQRWTFRSTSVGVPFAETSQDGAYVEYRDVVNLIAERAAQEADDER